MTQTELELQWAVQHFLGALDTGHLQDARALMILGPPHNRQESAFLRDLRRTVAVSEAVEQMENRGQIIRKQDAIGPDNETTKTGDPANSGASADSQALMSAAPPCEAIGSEPDTRAIRIERLLNVAHGCHDYGGGYRGTPAEEVYHHGIQTVINALEAAMKNDPKDFQINVLERIGADARAAIKLHAAALEVPDAL
jgi:hypothetical protein